MNLALMTEATYATYIAEAIPGYARENITSGSWCEETALEQARKEFEHLLPQGLATPDNFLYEIHDQREQSNIGMLWFALREQGGEKLAFVLDVVINTEYQRKGYATRALRLLEEKVFELGCSRIAMHVFPHNTGAVALYQKLGYRPTNMIMFKNMAHGCA